MERTIFLEHYRICGQDDDSAQQLRRTGAAIMHKAVDVRSDEPVAVEVIPTASADPSTRTRLEEQAQAAQLLDHVNIAKLHAFGVEDDHFIYVSEYLEGATLDAWVASQGPMAPDAVLRVGLQVAWALRAAAFHGLSHGAIQPANLMIVPGQAPDGGWPLAKLLHFGLTGLEDQLATPPEFASPEQLLNREVDFRSDIYSLGATMSFLLTGAVPLAASEMKARLQARRLPELRRSPKSLRNLLAHMLRENPDNRPQDPVAVENEIQECLTKVERRQAIGRRLGIPLAAVIPRKPEELEEANSPLPQVLRGIVVGAVLLAATAVVGGYLFPGLVPHWHRTGKVGVLVGIPEASTPAPVQSASRADTVMNPPIASTSPNDGQTQAVNSPPGGTSRPANGVMNAPIASTSPNDGQTQAVNSPPGVTSSPTDAAALGPSTPIQVAAATPATEPAPPSEAPAEPASASEPAPSSEAPAGPTTAAAETSLQDQAKSSAQTGQSASRNKKKTTASTSAGRSRSRRARLDQVPPNRQELEPRPRYHGSVRARFVGTTPDGRLILRLPSGRTVIVTPRSDGDDVFVPPPRRRIYSERPDVFVPPLEPFNPPGYPYND